MMLLCRQDAAAAGCRAHKQAAWLSAYQAPAQPAGALTVQHAQALHQLQQELLEGGVLGLRGEHSLGSGGLRQGGQGAGGDSCSGGRGVVGRCCARCRGG